MKLQHKLLLILFLTFMCAFGVLEYVQFKNIEKTTLESVQQQARNIRGILMSTRRIYHQQFIDSGLPLNEKTIGFLPAHALSLISKDFNSRYEYQISFNNVSDRPRNPDNTADLLEMMAIEFFRQNSDTDERFVPYDSPEGDEYYHFSTPIRTEQYCLKCHGRREDAPPTIRDTYTTAFDYKVGDIRGIMSIKLPATTVKALAWEHFRADFLIQLLSFLLLLAVIMWLVARYFTIPLSRLNRGLKQVAYGDFNNSISGFTGEMKAIGESFNRMDCQLKERERFLRKRESQLIESQKIAKLGSWDLNFLSQEFDWSAETYRLFDKDPQEFMPSFEEFECRVHPDDLEEMQTSFNNALQIGQPNYHAVVRILNDSGREWVMEAIGKVRWDTDGKALGMFGTVQNITERKQAEEALRASEEQFRGVVDNLGIGISLISPNMEVLSLNEQMRRWFPEIDPSKRPVCYQAFNSPPREGICSYSPTHLTLEDGEVHVAETETPAGDETRHYKIVASPLRDREGKIVAAIEMVEDITERKQAEEHIHNLAYFDALTGLPNRKLFFDRLDQGICRVERDEQSLALLYIDLDNFKNINDMLGHPAGDMLLKAVGKRLSENMRKSTTVARLGGDEFAIIIEDMSNQLDVTKVADRIIDSLKVPLKLRGHEVFISASLGIAIYPNDGDDVKTLLKNADTAMYHAKKQGRNNYQFFSTEMNVELEKRVGIETKLRYALEKNEFTLCYQPQVELENGTIIGVESLIRWHPDGGESISPADFIPVAEETSLILEIDRWVLYTACTQMRLWQEAGFVNRRISVNISGFHFRRARILEAVDTVLEETGLKPDCLEIEITEGVLMEDVNEAVSTLDQLRSRGVHIAVDDFGTGYSSLSYLRRFPINRIKIDRSFISDITTDRDNAAITRTIIAMAHNLNLEVIAEGVETKEQLDFLRVEGCDQMQGYYFSKPLPVDEFNKLMIKSQKNIVE